MKLVSVIVAALLASSCTILNAFPGASVPPILDQGVTFSATNDSGQLCALELMVWAETAGASIGSAHVAVGPKDQILTNDDGCAQYMVIWYHAEYTSNGIEWGTYQTSSFGPWAGISAAAISESATVTAGPPRRVAITAQLLVQIDFGDSFTICNLYGGNSASNDPDGICPTPLPVP